MKKTVKTSISKYPDKKVTIIRFSLMLSFLSTCSDVVTANSDLWDMSLADLGKIRVTSIASGTKTPLDKAAAIATVITENDITAMGATDLDQVLETVPGLHVARSSQGYTAKYIIRGITSTFNPQALVLINGIPVTSLFTGNRGNIWTGMPVKSIARIEVIRGPGSALYGADAFSGVINIITKTANDINGSKIAIRTGSFGSKAISFEQGGTYSNMDIGFTLEAETTDGWKKTVQQDQQTAFDGLFKTQASLAPGNVNTMKDMMEARLDVAYDHSRLRAGYQGRYHVGSSVGYAEALDPSSRTTSERYNVDYSYTLNDLTPNWGINSQVSYYKNTQEIEKNIYLYPKGAFGGAFPDGFIGNPGYHEENVRLDLSSLYKGINSHLIRLGIGGAWDDMYEVTETKNFSVAFLPDGTPIFPPRPNGIEDVSDTAEVYLPENQRQSYYLFMQDEWKFSRDWLATTGVRYDHFSDFGSTTNPRLALVWATTSQITTKLLYGRAFRAPSFSELFVTSNPISLGNTELEPETIDTYELALSHQLSSQWSYTANVYRYNIQDFITFVPIGSIAKAQNIGKRQGQGVELEADYAPAYNMRFLINYAYQHSEDRNSKSDVGEAPNHKIYGRSEWSTPSNLHIDSQITWVGKQKRVIGDTRAALAAYTTVDVTLRKQDVLNGLDLTLSVRNLFNADVREPSPVGAIPNDFPMAGRSLFAEAQYQF